MDRPLPSAEEMYQAVRSRDSRYDGIFFTGVKTTGVFCRPGCPARTPQQQNVEFFGTAREALAHGFRPCLRCTPLAPRGATPEPIARLIAEVEEAPAIRLRDRDLRERGLQPATVRRWFRTHHGMTFQGYQRARRMAGAVRELSRGAPVTRAAFGSGYESISAFTAALRQVTGTTASASRDAIVVHMTRVLTPLGPMVMGATDEGVCLLEFTDRRMLETQLRRLRQRLRCVFAPGRNRSLEQMEQELADYFAGRSMRFATPLVTPGSEFQQRAWRALREIPPGTTRSYAEQARVVGEPTAVRALARANGDNRISIAIPCHRLVGSDGSLTGYGGGLWRKRWLLHHEGVAPG